MKICPLHCFLSKSKDNMEAEGELDLDDENCVSAISAQLQSIATCSTCYMKIYYRILKDLASFYNDVTTVVTLK